MANYYMSKMKKNLNVKNNIVAFFSDCDAAFISD